MARRRPRCICLAPGLLSGDTGVHAGARGHRQGVPGHRGCRPVPGRVSGRARGGRTHGVAPTFSERLPSRRRPASDQAGRRANRHDSVWAVGSWRADRCHAERLACLLVAASVARAGRLASTPPGPASGSQQILAGTPGVWRRIRLSGSTRRNQGRVCHARGGLPGLCRCCECRTRSVDFGRVERISRDLDALAERSGRHPHASDVGPVRTSSLASRSLRLADIHRGAHPSRDVGVLDGAAIDAAGGHPMRQACGDGGRSDHCLSWRSGLHRRPLRLGELGAGALPDRRGGLRGRRRRTADSMVHSPLSRARCIGSFSELMQR
jgi:hypothetical protein